MLRLRLRSDYSGYQVAVDYNDPDSARPAFALLAVVSEEAACARVSGLWRDYHRNRRLWRELLLVRNAIHWTMAALWSCVRVIVQASQPQRRQRLVEPGCERHQLDVGARPRAGRAFPQQTCGSCDMFRRRKFASSPERCTQSTSLSSTSSLGARRLFRLRQTCSPHALPGTAQCSTAATTL